MTLSRDEFITTLAILTGNPGNAAGATIPIGSGSVAITYREEKPARLGGLLSLPRATVTLAFENVPDEARRDFLARFDRTFQRGGG